MQPGNDYGAKSAMVCSADDLVVWRDFPKGLRVLLLDEGLSSAAETRLKLEAMDYMVFSYQNEKDALEVISKKAESFHVAIVEVTTGNCHGSFRFLEMVKDLPTVVISNVSCLATMMKCIALGAAEFLEKPLSEDKLRNIWQHAVHKAFNTKGESKSLKPIKEKVSSMLQLQSETTEIRIEVPSEAKSEEKGLENDSENSVSSDRFSAPSTPQLKQGGRLLDDREYHDQPNCPVEKENSENVKVSNQGINSSSESKSVDKTCDNLTDLANKKEVSPSRVKEPACEEVDSADGSKASECSVAREGSLSFTNKRDHVELFTEDSKKKKPIIYLNSRSHGSRGNRTRMKVDWTPELHRRFVKAVEQLGINQAIPSKILELMNVEGLTRHNVASHLQKFRMHRRYILPKDDNRKWQPHRYPLSGKYMQKPPVVFPHHPNYGLPPQHVYSVWGHPSYHQPGLQMWGHPGFLPWQPPPESWHWKAYSGMHADEWGCPIVPSYAQYTFPSQVPLVSNGLDVGEISKVLKDPNDIHLEAEEEMIDKALAEAMNKPWLPLPLGLKPPSVNGVLAELHRQGIGTMPAASAMR